MDDMEELYDVMRSGRPYTCESLVEGFDHTLLLCKKFNDEEDPEFRRRIFEEIIGKELDPSVKVIPPFMTEFGKFIEIGKDVMINYRCSIAGQGGVRIGDRVMVGPNVSLITTNHGREPDRRMYLTSERITLCDDVWIGAGAIILPGVTVGEGSIIGAGSVVTRDVPPMSVAVGNPARVIKEL